MLTAYPGCQIDLGEAPVQLVAVAGDPNIPLECGKLITRVIYAAIAAREILRCRDSDVALCLDTVDHQILAFLAMLAGFDQESP